MAHVKRVANSSSMSIEYSIEVEHLTKKFRVVHRESSLKSAALGRLRLRRPRVEEFTALSDISFLVPKGQTIGIIGSNGSGKSTLLALLTRIYNPTAGRIQVRGRVAAMLELGAGFHPEFTGVENILLNGAILGIPRSEMEAQLPDIIEFADIGDFVDTKVKHYSSGMLTRLGFSVAAHSNPDVMLIDEVLAVGDANFRQKCYARLDKFKTRGVTILVVSHNADDIRRVCDRVLWLDNHIVKADGTVEDVMAQYSAVNDTATVP